MRQACAVALAAITALMAGLPATAGTLEACRAAQAGSVAQCVQAARKAASVELASAESTRRAALRALIAANNGTDRGAAMAFDRTVRAHQLYRQAECDLSRRLARNTPDADLAEAACEADLSRERIGALREAAAPATPAAAPAAPN